MKLAIMQPYFFPYIGYFQLINTVDKFIIYDDVNFIKQGWINRNNVLVNNSKYLFSIPLKNISSFCLIKDTIIDEINYSHWLSKFLKMLTSAYSKSPHYDSIFNVIKDLFTISGKISISDFNVAILRKICTLLQINTEIISHSDIYRNQNLNGVERVIDICRQESASTYINAIGGQSLYDKDFFSKNGIQLYFLKPFFSKYIQGKSPFIEGLSIIDVLMFNDVNETIKMLNNYELL